MTETVEQKPIELTLGDGTVVKGKDYDEALKNLAKMKEDTANALKAERERRELLENQFAQTQAEVEALKAPKHKDGEFDKGRYYQLLNDDPIEAQNYLDVFRFGTPDPVGRFDEIGQKVDSLYQQNLTASFWAQHPEFPGGKEAARAMTSRVQELIQNGHPLVGETMELAYSQLVREETIKPVEQKTEDERPNPSLSAGSGGGPNIIDDAKIQNMNDEQLKAYMRSVGVKGI